jgi:hypothetical protein
VAVAIGKLDAIFFIVGILGGIFLFGVTVPEFHSFNLSGALGNLTLQAWFNLNTGIIALAVVLLALGAFWPGEKSEGAWNVFGRLYGRWSKGGESHEG